MYKREYERSSSGGGGLGVGTVLGIIFIVLKLCGVITWSWLWVLSPFWIGAIISIVVLLLFFLLTH